MSDEITGELWVEIEPLPEELPAGRGDAVFVFGACFHPRDEVTGLEALVDGIPHPVTDFGLPRLDIFRRLHPNLGGGEPPVPPVDRDSLEDPEVRCYRSGFWATVPLPARELGAETVIAVRAMLGGGQAAVAEVARTGAGPAPLGHIDPSAPTDPEAARVAVVMATHNPDMDLFRAQVRSLREQTDRNWVCVVSDDRSRPDRFREIAAELAGDERFVLERGERRLGFYRSFERALGMVPADAALVALCDQDDRWYPDKLATLRAAIGSSELVYSDQRLVDADGSELAPTYWTNRRNNHTNLLSLLIANTITGAASMMRREVIERALPFPDVPSEQYHDHWLGLVALSMGDVEYVDRPLYDYVQHRGAALGHAKANAGIEGRGGLRERIGITYWRARFADAHAAYFRSYVRLELLARALLERVPEATRRKRSTLRRFAWADRSRAGIVWLRLRGFRGLVSNETLGAERMLAESLLWRHGMRHHSRDWDRPIGSPFDASLPPPEGRLEGEAAGEAYPDPETAHIERLLAPLGFSVSAAEPERVNILIPTIDLRHLFGGYIAKFNLARKLAEAGHRVRIVTVDPTPELPADWRCQVESYSGLAGAMSTVEVAFAREQGEVAISPRDRFVATTWWTAYHARDAISRTEADRFLYLIHEFEPFTFVMGSWAAIAAETYSFPHAALFSTEFLRAYFAANRIGVYAGDRADGDRDSVSFQNAITPVSTPTTTDLADRESRRLLFYARSEPHAKRNMFELGMIALSRAIETRVLGDEWEFFGIGSVSGRSRVALSGGNELDVLPRQRQSRYGEILGGYDIGLSLMLTPHPSLVPIEMASAGLLTVTNTFETKTAERLTAISGNLIPAAPSIDGVVAGLAEAVGRVDDHAARIGGAAVDWSDDWEQSLDGRVVGSVVRLLGLE
jgi:glycosyltransferase involved in cell wall biosynthesis